jgi:hypothetical protein
LLIIEAYESRLCSGPETVAAAVVNTVVEVELKHIIEAYESRLCSVPETVAAAVVNTVVEVEDPTAQIINYQSKWKSSLLRARDGGGCCGGGGGNATSQIINHRSKWKSSLLRARDGGGCCGDTVVEVEMQHPRLLIIEANERRLCSGPETVAAAVVNTVVEVHCIKSEVYLAKWKWILRSGPKLKMLVKFYGSSGSFPNP